MKGRIKYTRETLTQEALKSIIHYDSETGKFTWAVGRGQSNAGGRPGSLDRDGYLRIGIDGTYYGAHRLAWLIHYGEWPKGIVDHINRDKLDNRIANLRDTNCSVNGMNTMRASGKSKSGLRGVAYRAETGRWSAKIKVDGKCIWLGTYATPEEAHEVYMKAKATYHHEHFEDSRSSVDQWQQRATRAEAQVEELKKNAKKAWEECHAMSSELSKANQDRDRWRECAVYLDYRGADYCVAIHKELDGLQADNAEHREQMSRLLKNWKSRATRAEAALSEQSLSIVTMTHMHDALRRSNEMLAERATRAEAELADIRRDNANLRDLLAKAVAERDSALDKLQAKVEECAKAKLERDEASGKCERLREVAKAATDRLVCDASCPARITGAEVDCTCGLVAVYDALDAALAECEEVA